LLPTHLLDLSALTLKLLLLAHLLFFEALALLVLRICRA
jgi:hypothetical protein